MRALLLVSSIFLSLLCLAGCNSRTTQPPTLPATHTPTQVQATLSQPTATLAPSATPTFTPRSRATFTPAPSQTNTSRPSTTSTLTPSRTYTSRPSPTFTLTPTPTPDWNAFYTGIADAVMTATPARVVETHVSPDGKWRLELIHYDCVDVGAGEEIKNAYEQLRLVKTDNGLEKIVVDQLQYCEGIGAYGLGFVYWSSDSHYLYYTDSAYGVPDGGGMAWYPSLYRYEVQSEAIMALRWGPLAPDGVTMAYPDQYRGQQELALYLWDMDKGEIARIPSALPPSSPFPGIYELAWSPDGRSLVYIEAENSDGIDGKSWIIQWDITTFERRVIYQSDSGLLCCIKWVSARRIQVNNNSNENQYFDLPPVGLNIAKPTSLWCERPDTLAATKVAITHLPGAPQSSCIVWVASSEQVNGYRVELKDVGRGEVFQYISGPYGTQWVLPLKAQPRLGEAGEPGQSQRSYSVSVYARTEKGEILVGATSVEVDNPDFLSLPTATSTP